MFLQIMEKIFTLSCVFSILLIFIGVWHLSSIESKANKKEGSDFIRMIMSSSSSDLFDFKEPHINTAYGVYIKPPNDPSYYLEPSTCSGTRPTVF